MNDLSIEEFCDKHDACSDGREWAIKNCRDMAHAWETLKPEWLVWVATRDGVLDDKTLRLFAVWCARQVQHLMKDKRSVVAIDVSERFAHGNATAEELATAMDAARAASRPSASDAAWAASRPSASDAALDAAWAAAWDAASNAASDAAMESQADWLHKNAKPSFK